MLEVHEYNRDDYERWRKTATKVFENAIIDVTEGADIVTTLTEKWLPKSHLAKAHNLSIELSVGLSHTGFIEQFLSVAANAAKSGSHVMKEAHRELSAANENFPDLMMQARQVIATQILNHLQDAINAGEISNAKLAEANRAAELLKSGLNIIAKESQAKKRA